MFTPSFQHIMHIIINMKKSKKKLMRGEHRAKLVSEEGVHEVGAPIFFFKELTLRVSILKAQNSK